MHGRSQSEPSRSQAAAPEPNRNTAALDRVTSAQVRPWWPSASPNPGGITLLPSAPRSTPPTPLPAALASLPSRPAAAWVTVAPPRARRVLPALVAASPLLGRAAHPHRHRDQPVLDGLDRRVGPLGDPLRRGRAQHPRAPRPHRSVVAGRQRRARRHRREGLLVQARPALLADGAEHEDPRGRDLGSPRRAGPALLARAGWAALPCSATSPGARSRRAPASSPPSCWSPCRSGPSPPDRRSPT